MKIQKRQSDHLARRGFLQTLALGAAGIALGVRAATAVAQSTGEATRELVARGHRVWKLTRKSDEEGRLVIQAFLRG